MTRFVVATTLTLLTIAIILDAILELNKRDKQKAINPTSTISKSVLTGKGVLKQIPTLIPTLTPEQIKSEIIRLTNAERTKERLPALKENSLLNQSATMKANDMYKRDYFDHIDPDGKEPWHFFQQVGYVYGYAGENLGIDYYLSEDYDNSKTLIESWIASKGHKVNIVSQLYNEIGIGFSPNFRYVVAHYGSQRATYDESSITTNTTPSRTGRIVPYHDWCNNKDISVYENEIIVKKSSDGNIYGMTTDDWECYENYLKQKAN